MKYSPIKINSTTIIPVHAINKVSKNVDGDAVVYWTDNSDTPTQRSTVTNIPFLEFCDNWDAVASK